MSPQRTGVGHYTMHLLRHLPGVDPGTTYVAWYPSARTALGLTRASRLFVHDRPPNLIERPVPISYRWFERLSAYGIPRVEWTVRFDVLFAPNFIPPPTRTRNLVVTVHDLAFRLFPATAPAATRQLLSRLESVLRRATRIIVVSEQTRRDLLDTYHVTDARVSVVPLGVDTAVIRRAPEAAVDTVRERYGIEGPYLLALGGIEPRKNLPAIIRAYAALSPSVRPTLVLAGPVTPWNPEGWQLLGPALDRLPPSIRERIVFTDYVSETAKVALLSGAEALLYPSLYEGFGLPVIEAMACGTPVLTSNVSALPATAGGAALLVDPMDVESITEGIERILTDPALGQTLRAAGLARAGAFSWERTAALTAEVLHKAHE
jgi:glycosyltransferase involved in cell wall biosynthesis